MFDVIPYENNKEMIISQSRINLDIKYQKYDDLEIQFTVCFLTVIDKWGAHLFLSDLYQISSIFWAILSCKCCEKTLLTESK